MTSEEIKMLRDEAQKTQAIALQVGCSYKPPDWLAEIAYQLAVVNEQLHPILCACLTPKVIITEPKGGANL